MTDSRRPSPIATVCGIVLLCLAGTVKAGTTKALLPAAAPLSNQELAQERGRGETRTVTPGTQLAVILWDERGTPKTNKTPGPVDSVSQGVGNHQLNSLTQN